jgi:hypothetical protein
MVLRLQVTTRKNMFSVGPFRKILDWSLLQPISSSEEKTENFTTKTNEAGL